MLLPVARLAHLQGFTLGTVAMHTAELAENLNRLTDTWRPDGAAQAFCPVFARAAFVGVQHFGLLQPDEVGFLALTSLARPDIYPGPQLSLLTITLVHKPIK